MSHEAPEPPVEGAETHHSIERGRNLGDELDAISAALKALTARVDALNVKPEIPDYATLVNNPPDEQS